MRDEQREARINGWRQGLADLGIEADNLSDESVEILGPMVFDPAIDLRGGREVRVIVQSGIGYLTVPCRLESVNFLDDSMFRDSDRSAIRMIQRPCVEIRLVSVPRDDIETSGEWYTPAQWEVGNSTPPADIRAIRDMAGRFSIPLSGTTEGTITFDGGDMTRPILLPPAEEPSGPPSPRSMAERFNSIGQQAPMNRRERRRRRGR